MNSSVSFFFIKSKTFQPEIAQLRKIVLDCGLTEELKWGNPCYSFEGKNIVLIHVFKEYCALLFFKGALLKDSYKILIQQTERVQAARQIRFTNLKEIVKLAPKIKAHIYEAIEVEKAGLKVPLKKTSEYSVPDEFKQKCKEVPNLKAAFNELTPGRQRAYLLHFSEAKQSKTRIARIDKCIPNIFQKKGLNE